MSESSAATLDTLQLKVIELAHRRATLRESGQAYCKLDGEPWPCNAQRLIASVRAARHAQQQAAALMAAAREWDAARAAWVDDYSKEHRYIRAVLGLTAALATAERDASSAGESAT